MRCPKFSPAALKNTKRSLVLEVDFIRMSVKIFRRGCILSTNCPDNSWAKPPPPPKPPSLSPVSTTREVGFNSQCRSIFEEFRGKLRLYKWLLRYFERVWNLKCKILRKSSSGTNDMVMDRRHSHGAAGSPPPPPFSSSSGRASTPLPCQDLPKLKMFSKSSGSRIFLLRLCCFLIDRLCNIFKSKSGTIFGIHVEIVKEYWKQFQNRIWWNKTQQKLTCNSWTVTRPQAQPEIERSNSDPRGQRTVHSR